MIRLFNEKPKGKAGRLRRRPTHPHQRCCRPGYTRSGKKRSFKTRIFIGGVPSHFKEQDLKEYFEAFGPIFSVKLKKKKKTSEVNLGFGTITVDCETAERVLVTNFHVIQGRKIECQRFVKNNKADNKMIRDKKLKTLYITEPQAGMDEARMKVFFGKIGELENAYILPERKIPSDEPDLEFEVLKKKALLLFRSVGDARKVLQLSESGGLVFEGEKVVVHHKWPEGEEEELRQTGMVVGTGEACCSPEQMKNCCGGLKVCSEQRCRQEYAGDGEDGPNPGKSLASTKQGSLGPESSCNLRRGPGGSTRGCCPKNGGNAAASNQRRSPIPTLVKSGEGGVSLNSETSVNLKSFNMECSADCNNKNGPCGKQLVQELFGDQQEVRGPGGGLSGRGCQKGSQASLKNCTKTSNGGNGKNFNLKKNQRTLDSWQSLELVGDDWSQGELLRDLPEELRRGNHYHRQPYLSNLWGRLPEELEKQRRKTKPTTLEYNHAECICHHSGDNIRQSLSTKNFKKFLVMSGLLTSPIMAFQSFNNLSMNGQPPQRAFRF